MMREIKINFIDNDLPDQQDPFDVKIIELSIGGNFDIDNTHVLVSVDRFHESNDRYGAMLCGYIPFESIADFVDRVREQKSS